MPLLGKFNQESIDKTDQDDEPVSGTTSGRRDTDVVEYSSSSSSDSESDDEGASEVPVDPGKTLTLEDDDSTALIIPPGIDLGEASDDAGEADDYVSQAPNEICMNKDSTAVTSAYDLDTDLDDKPKKKKKKKKKWYYICLANCKYDSVRRVSKRYGFKEVNEDDDWNLYWTDFSVTLERVMDMKKYQKINHFPGMSEICRKDLLARNLNRMLKLYPKEYNVFPRSWCLPADQGDFLAFTRAKKHKTYILKPESGCQGKGIWITKNPKDIKPHEHMLCQQYLSKPFTVDGFKFDLRIYILVTSCDPLRIFLFKDGLARFATTPYVEPTHNNTSNVFMHLTNYAINKNSSDFVRDDDSGSKRKISTVCKWMEQNGLNVDKMWEDVDDVIIKTLISAHSVLKHNYRTCFPNHVRGSACFEILGFDIMFDRKLKPFVLEVNHSPSFHTDAKLDKEIKEALIYDTLNLVNFGAVDRRKCIEEERRKIKERLFQRQNKKESKEELDKMAAIWMEEQEKYEDAHLGNFRRIYPLANAERYEKYFHSSGSLYQETAAFKARSELARQQREEIARKQEKLESMLRKKKEPGLRPESPGSRRRRQSNVGRRPSNRTQRLAARTESYASLTGMQHGEGRGGAIQEPIDTRKPLDINEEEELERISALLQRDNLVRGLGIVEHVYRLLHCTPGTMGIQIKNDKFSLSGHEMFGIQTNTQPKLTDAGLVGNNNYSFNNNMMRGQQKMYHQGLVNTHKDIATTQWSRRVDAPINQLQDRVLPHRTRYTSRGQAGPGRAGGVLGRVLPDAEYRQISSMLESANNAPSGGGMGPGGGQPATVYGRHGYEVRGDSAGSQRRTQHTYSASSSAKQRSSKMTPRQAGLTQHSPDPQLPSQQPLPQVGKVTGSAGGGGVSLSVVSAPAPMAACRDLGSASLTNQRVMLQQQPSEKLGATRGRGLPPRLGGGALRGAGGAGAASGGVRMKQMEINGNHAIVFS